MLVCSTGAHPRHGLDVEVTDHRHVARHPRIQRSAPSSQAQLHVSHEGRSDPVEEPSDEPRKPACSPDVELLQHVLTGPQKLRSSYFKDGDAFQGLESEEFARMNLTLPRGCQKWKSEPHCCKPQFFKKISATTVVEDLNFVRDQYANFKEDIIDEAEKTADESTTKLLKEAADLAAPGIQAVLDFIDSCEDPIRLFFSSMACSLCASNLHQNLTEQQTLHVSAESCGNLKSSCQKMPQRLEEAGRAFLHARDLLKKGQSEDPWYQHSQTWLDRAGKLALLRSKHVNFYKTEDFCKAIEHQGFVYTPELWGNVLMLHISSLATDEEQQSFLSQDELRYFIPKEGEVQKLKEEAMNIESEFKGLDAEAFVQVHSKEVNEVHILKFEELKCVHGKKMGNHCSCSPCWTGIECDKPMSPGPYTEQDFEPLVVQINQGAQQSLAIQGCDLHVDLRHQLARITLIPLPSSQRLPEKGMQDSLCRDRAKGNNGTEALKIRIPETASQKEYVYLIDVPLGDANWYQVCYCYGVECTDEDGLHAWQSLGDVQVVRTHQERDEIVLEMFSKEAILARRQREKEGKKNCSHDWNLPKDTTFYEENFGDTVRFKCREGYSTPKGVSELVCDGGIWKVASSSSSSTAASPVKLTADMETWDAELPQCAWMNAASCSNESGIDVIEKDSGSIVVNTFSADGLVHYRCLQQDSTQPMRLVVKGFPEVFQPKDQVVVNRTQIAQVLSYDDQTQTYQVRLLTGLNKDKEERPEHLEWLMKETSFTRKCEGDKFTPSNVTVRCLMVIPTDDDVVNFEPAAEEAAYHLGWQASSLMQQQEETKQIFQQATKEEQLHGEAWEADQPLLLQPWPLRLSLDKGRAFHVDACWTSPLNCSDGQPAEDTVRYLQKEPVLPEDSHDPQSRMMSLGGCLTVAVLLVLLGWSGFRHIK